MIRRVRRHQPLAEPGRVGLVCVERQHPVDRRAISGTLIQLPHVRTGEHPSCPGDPGEGVYLLGRHDRPAQPGLCSLDPHHPEVVCGNPGPAAEQRLAVGEWLEADDVGPGPGNRLLAGKAVAGPVPERDDQRQGSRPLRLDDRQPRHAALLEGDAVHADVALLEIRSRRVPIDGGPARYGDWRGEPWRFERDGQGAGGDERPHLPALTLGRRLMTSDDLLDGETPRGGNPDVRRKAIARRLCDAYHRLARGELHPLRSGWWFDRHRRSGVAPLEHGHPGEGRRVEIGVCAAGAAGDAQIPARGNQPGGEQPGRGRQIRERAAGGLRVGRDTDQPPLGGSGTRVRQRPADVDELAASHPRGLNVVGAPGGHEEVPYPAPIRSANTCSICGGGSTPRRTGAAAWARRAVSRWRSSNSSGSAASVDVRMSRTMVGTFDRPGRAVPGGSPCNRRPGCPPRCAIASSSNATPGAARSARSVSTSTSRPCRVAGSRSG